MDEFAVLGFKLSCDLNLESDVEFDSFLDDFLGLLADLNLYMGGGGNTESFSAFVCSNHRYSSASNDDRDTVKKWLESNSSVSNVAISQLIDANYGPF